MFGGLALLAGAFGLDYMQGKSMSKKGKEQAQRIIDLNRRVDKKLNAIECGVEKDAALALQQRDIEAKHNEFLIAEARKNELIIRNTNEALRSAEEKVNAAKVEAAIAERKYVDVVGENKALEAKLEAFESKTEVSPEVKEEAKDEVKSGAKAEAATIPPVKVIPVASVKATAKPGPKPAVKVIPVAPVNVLANKPLNKKQRREAAKIKLAEAEAKAKLATK